MIMRQLEMQDRQETERTPSGLPILVTLFMIGLIIPSIIQLGSIRLSAYRIVLLVVTLPCLMFWLQGKAGRMRVSDFAVLGLCFWSALSFSVHHGAGPMIEQNGIFFLETAGAYFLGRCYIRTAETFYAMVRLFFWTVMLMLPFAVHEAWTGDALYMGFFDKFSDTPRVFEKEIRLGLTRVQGPFDHQILFGVYCGSMVAMVHLVLGYGESFFRRSMRTSAVMLTAFFALSSGPLMAQVAQIGLLGWDWLFRNFRARWTALISMCASMVIAIEIAANRSTPAILIAYLAFNTSTALNRIRIWEYGSANVANHPLLGLGLNDWERPDWMVASVDMFWLLQAMRNGLPAGILLFVAVLGIFLQAAFRTGLDARTSSYRTGYLLSIVGVVLAGWTVHYWNATYALVMFMVGAGAFFADVPAAGETAVKVQPKQRTLRYSRFPPNGGAGAHDGVDGNEYNGAYRSGRGAGADPDP